MFKTWTVETVATNLWLLLYFNETEVHRPFQLLMQYALYGKLIIGGN